MRDSLDITTIIFAVLAIIVIWKLRSVLGTRTGAERPRDPFQARTKTIDGSAEKPYPKSDEGNVIRLPGAANDPGPPVAAAGADQAADPDRWKGFAEPDSKVWAGLDAIRAADPGFQAQSFLAGAKAAYEMIVTAFAAGDRKALRSLLARDVFDSFAGAITEREGRGEKVETTFVSMEKATLEEAQLRASSAQISVRFLSKLITATRDKAGTIVDGSPDKVVDMVDIWTFARDVASRDPNWKLVATESGH
ncbi:MAG: Tim44 domain-containing protein [Methylobacteriaceae bacterium]|nr:Tim44 domain-containing protein [Methylobacteriaceae bacterium]